MRCMKYFPGGGHLSSRSIGADRRKLFEFIDHLKIFSLLANVADVKSGYSPATTAHAELNEQELENVGIHQNTIRLSIGTEDAEDIIWDLDQAFQAVGK